MTHDEIREAVRNARVCDVTEHCLTMLLSEPIDMRIRVIEGMVDLYIEGHNLDGSHRWEYLQQGHSLIYTAWEPYFALIREEALLIHAALEAMPPGEWEWNKTLMRFQRQVGSIVDVVSWCESSPWIEAAECVHRHRLHEMPAYAPKRGEG